MQSNGRLVCGINRCRLLQWGWDAFVFRQRISRCRRRSEADSRRITSSGPCVHASIPIPLLPSPGLESVARAPQQRHSPSWWHVGATGPNLSLVGLLDFRKITSFPLCPSVLVFFKQVGMLLFGSCILNSWPCALFKGWLLLVISPKCKQKQWALFSPWCLVGELGEITFRLKQ